MAVSILPDFGQIIRNMLSNADTSELIDRLTRTSRLTRTEAAHLVDEVFAFLDESFEEFVRRRHRDLQREGRPNPAIFAQIAEEVRQRRFRGPALSERQIRRLIYG
jgi:hypothetical protein